MANAQTTYYSRGSINFNASGAGTWNTAADGSGANAPASHEDGGNNYIILNGHTVTVNDDITANRITVGDATTATNGTLTIGNGTAGYTITLADAFSVRTGSTVNTSNTGTHTHAFSISGDITLAGTVTFANSNTVNMTMTGVVATILSGSGAITLDNLTINGGVARVISTSSTPTISGNLLVDGAGTEVSIASSLNIGGNYTISNSASWNSVAGTITFNGATAQSLNLTGGTTNFFGLTFDNGTSANLKTINGDLVVNGTTRITNDAFVTSTNQNHQLEDLRLDATDGTPIAANFSGGTITFRGYNGSNVDIYGQAGDFTFQVGSNNCNIIIQGNTWIQAGDNVRVAGNIDIQSGYIVLNGSTPVGNTYTLNSTLKPMGGVARSFTMATNTNFYIRGADNFPLYQTTDPDGHFTFTFANDSWVRYDTESNQTVRANAGAGYPTVNYNNLLFSQTTEPDTGNPRLTKTLATGHTLDVEGQFRLANGITFLINDATQHTFAGNITIDDAAVWTATTATIKLDAADASQVMQGNGVTYNFGSFVIEQTAPTAVRTKTIQADINVAGGGSISITNPNGDAANYLQINLNTFVFSANGGAGGTNDFFTLGENCRLITTADNFLTGFNDAGDNINIHENSIIRFDLNGGDQGIPDIGTNYYGTIELWGDGRKFPVGTNLNIAGDMRVVAYTPVFQFRQYLTDAYPIDIIIEGDWDMNQAWTAPFDGALNNSTITFAGADQYVSGSDFHNVIFSGTGTKTVNGSLNIEGSLTINTGVTVDLSDNFVQIDEDWTVNGTGKFIQTTGTTRFEGGTGVTTQTITIADPTQSQFGNLTTDNNITLVFASDVTISRTLDTDDTSITTPENGAILSFAGRTLKIGNDFFYRRSTSMVINTSSKLIFNGDTDQSIQYLDDTDGTGDGADNGATNDIDDDNDDIFPAIEFDGVGRKAFVVRTGTMWWLINGNVSIGNSSTVDGNNRVIVVSGNWSNLGSFLQNGSTLVFTHITADTNPAQTISTSTFNSMVFGSPNGILNLTVGQNYYSGTAIDENDTGTKTLLGNISLSSNLTIAGVGAELTTLEGSNFDISLAGNWTNNGIFNPQTGSVTFNGSGTQTVSSANGTATNKRFYDLKVIKSSNTTLNFSNTALVSSRIDVLGDLTITSGIFSMNATGTPSAPNDLYIAGSFLNSDIFTWNDSYNNTDSNFPEIIFNGTSGTHTINFGIADIDQGRNVMGRMIFDASGATYQLATNTFFIDDTDCSLTITNGTLDLNGWRLTMGRGGISQTGGTLSVDAGAALVLNATTDLGTGTVNTSPDYINAGGTLSIMGTSDLTATITSESTTNGFQYVQTSGNTVMEYYTVSNSESGGMEFNGGTISNFSNGTYTGGTGTAYLTFSNVALGAISANNVVFNSGPTSNLSTSGTGMSGAITFVIAGGTLAGAANETDVPDGGAATGFFQWDFPDGWYWEGDVSTNWHTAGNWGKDGSVTDDGADGLPDPDDFVYIGQGYIGPNNPTISASNVTVSRITIDNPRNLTLATNRTLTVLGNITNAGTITTTDNTNTITVHGSWASDATTSSFVETQSTVVFKGETGNFSISTRETSNTSANIDASTDPFYNLTINSRNLADTEDGDAVYAMGSNIRVNNIFNIIGGTFDASTGFIVEFAGTNLTIDDGGVFNAGAGSTYINGTTGTQTLNGGTFFNLLFRNAATKSIGANILVEGTITFENVGTPGALSCNDKTIFVGDDWTNNVGTSVFDEGTGTVVFNQQSGTQVISGDTEFFKLVFQNPGTKQIAAGSTALTGTDIVVRGDLNMISDQNNLLQILQDDDLAFPATITGVGTNNFNMTGGTLQVFGGSFPTNFASYNFTAGTVDYRGDRNQNIVGNLSYFNLTIRTDNDPDINGGTAGPDVDRTKTLLDDIIVQGALTIDNNSSADGQVIFVPNGKTITLAGNLDMGNGLNRIDWNNQGTLIHNGAGWNIDADIQDSDGNAFHNLTLQGTGTKTMTSNLNISGSVLVDQAVTMAMSTFTMTGDGGDTFTMEESSFLTTAIPAATGEALPLNFGTYALNEASTVTLNANVNQTVSNDAIYGNLVLSTNGTATLVGNIFVNGNFTSNSVTTLADAGFNMELNGATVTINNYPSPSSTITFARTGDQTIQDNTTASGDAFILNNVIFDGSGIKTLTSNNGNDYYDINGDLTVNAGVTVTTTRLILFGGQNFTNNGGAFYTTNGTYPMTFDRATGNQTINPGATNGFESITFTDGATKTVVTNGFNIENTSFNLVDGGIVDFGNITHTLACATFNVDPSLWDVADANLIFDRVFLTGVRNGNQQIPGMTVNNVTFAGSDTKTLVDNFNANNITINESVTLDASTSGPFNIVVRGNWLNNGGTFQPRTGTVYFESTASASKTITPATSTFYNVIFHDDAGSQAFSSTYTLVDDVTITEDMTIRAGATFDVNDEVLTLGNDDADDPEPETQTIGAGGTLLVGAGGTLQFDCADDLDDALNYGAVLDVFGTLEIVGTASNVANLTRSNGGDRIDIDVEGTGKISARYYHIQYLVDEGLQVKAGAEIDATNNFSNGTWSNMATGNVARVYLELANDGTDIPNTTISGVTFNYGGTPNTSFHRNVKRDPSLTTVVTFTNTGGLLGNPGSYYEFETGTTPAPTATAHNTGILLWDAPTFAVWEGDLSNDWHTAGNWVGNLPPSSTLPNAQIGTGNPYPCVISATPVTGANRVYGNLTITNGILKLQDANSQLDIDGDFVAGQATGSALLVANTAATITVGKNLTIGGTTVFENGNGTVILDAAASTTATVTPGTQPFYNVSFTNGGLYNYAGADLYVDNNLTLSTGATVTPSNTNYNLYVKGNIVGTGATFNTGIDGEVILNGANQTITDINFDELTVQGTGTKDFTVSTASNILINDNLIIRNGATLKGSCSIDMDGNVTIEDGGVWEGVASQTYYFSGTDWIAGNGSYTGAAGTMNFNRFGGTQFIRQHTSGAANAAEFHNLSFLGSTSRVELGRIVNSVQYEGNVDLTGDLYVDNSINEFWVWTYLIQNTINPSGTFTLEANETIDVRGFDNYPKGFATYNVDAASFTRFFATSAQMIRGRINDTDPSIVYGNVILDFASTKTLGGAVDINGYLEIREAILDASTDNYSINIAGNWDNQQDGENGSFICRQGTVTFDGSGNTQNIFIGASGTQDFYNIIVNKSSGTASLISNNVNITGNLTSISGTFNINNLRATISGNMNANNLGLFSSGAGATALYKLIGSATSHTIRTNGSIIPGNMEIAAGNRTYILEDNLTVNNDFTLTSGIFETNGKTANLCDGADNVTILGDFRVSTTSRPGGTLALGPNTQLVVKPGGTFRIIGTTSNGAKLTRRSGTTGRYNFNVVGEMGNPGTMHARFALLEFMGQDGIFLNEFSLIDETNNFSDVTFNNGASGGKFLRIENEQDLLDVDGNAISNVSFPTNPGGGATNVYKTTKTTGTIEFKDFSGNFSGESYDEDPNDLITWILPDLIYWTGLSSSDWFTDNNWYNGSDDSRVVPTSSDDVIIPTFGIPFTVGSETFTVINEPIIGLPYTGYLTQQASAKNITIQTSANIVLNTNDNVDKGVGDAGIDPDLLIANDLNFAASSELESKGSNQDIVSVGGAWNKLTGALLTAGTSEVILDFQAGIRTLDNGSDPFYDLTIDAEGTVQLGRAIVINNDFSVTSGSFTQSNFQMTIAGDFRNYGNFDATLATVLMLPNNTTERFIRCGGDSFYNLLLGRQSPVSSSPKYTMEDDLYVLHNLDVVKGSGTIELDLNGSDIYQGDNDGVEDDANIYGLVTVSGGENLYLTGDANWVVQSTGTLNFLGTDNNVRATATRQSGSTGGYNITVESGGTFRARYYTFAYLEGNVDSGNKKAGLWIKTGANTPTSEDDGFTTDGDFTSEQNQPIPSTGYPTILNYGSFTNGQGYRYLTIDNNFAGSTDYIAREVSFGTGPTRNVKRSNSATNNINFRNYAGLLSGALLEDDDFSALTGKVRWSSQYVIYLWTGVVSTAWEDPNNWKLEDNSIPADYPNDQSFVIIPPKNNQRDVSNALVSPQRDPIWPSGLSRVSDPYTIANLVLQPDVAVNTGGKLFVASGVNFTVSQNIEIGGNAELNIAGNGGVAIGDSWINVGIFTPNQTTVTLISDDDEQFGGGVKFYNLVINSSNPSGAVFTSTADLDVENDFTITNGTYEITSNTHDVNIGGDFTVDEDGTFTSIVGSKVTFDGTSSQVISIYDPAVSKFYNVDFDTDGTISLNSNAVIDGDLVILSGATFSQGANDLELKGNWTNYGVFTAGAGTIIFNGTTPQNITGTSNQTFSNFQVFNTSPTVVDVFLLRNTFITSNLTFTEGIIESGESNYLQFNDGATHTGFNSSNYVIGPVRKAGDDDFIFPVGDLTRSAGIAINDLTDVSNIFKGEYTTGQNANAIDDQGSDFATECSNCDTGLNRVSILESWDLERVTGTEYPRIGLYFPDISFSGISASDFANLVVAHYNSGTSKWEILGNNNAGSIGAGYIEAANIPTSLSPITFGNLLNGNNPLPVTLVSFTGKPVNETVVLDWATASEFNNDYFEVQRSEDGLTFETLGKVNGNGTTNVRKDYQFTDVEPIIGVNYYRLKQVDTNGAFEYSKVIAVSFSQDDLGGSQILVYPNPARNQDKVNVELKGFAPEREVSIQLIDLTGKVLNVSMSKTNKSGTLRESVNLPTQMASGVYNLLIQDGEKSYSKRIVIQ
jgi:hypothetical protein